MRAYIVSRDIALKQFYPTWPVFTDDPTITKMADLFPGFFLSSNIVVMNVQLPTLGQHLSVKIPTQGEAHKVNFPREAAHPKGLTLIGALVLGFRPFGYSGLTSYFPLNFFAFETPLPLEFFLTFLVVGIDIFWNCTFQPQFHIVWTKTFHAGDEKHNINIGDQYLFSSTTTFYKLHVMYFLLSSSGYQDNLVLSTGLIM